MEDQVVALHLAAARGYGVAVKHLLDSGVPPDAAAPGVTGHTQTALFCAALTGRSETIRLLLSAGASPLSTAAAGGPLPLHAAIAFNHLEALALLLAAAPEAAAWRAGRCSALHLAIEKGSTAAVRLILQAAPDAARSALSDRGLLPLHVAASTGKPELVQLLLQAAPETAAAVTASGFRPLDIAIRYGDAAAVRLLVAAAPGTALLKDFNGDLPLELALKEARAACGFRTSSASPKYVEAARPLVAATPPAQALRVLSSPRLARTALPLFADLLASWPLSQQQWEAVPKRCPGLGRALPAVLARSEQEAAQLVAHLTPVDRRRLHTAALCLARRQRRLRVVLPADPTARILSLMFA